MCLQLKDMPEKAWGDPDQSDLSKHVKARKPGTENPLDEPLKFNKRALRTFNPAESDLKPDEMIRRTFLVPPRADGSRRCAETMSTAREMKEKAHAAPDHIKFKCLVNNDFKDVVVCNNIVDCVEKDVTWGGVWNFEKILSQKRLKASDKGDQAPGICCLVLWSTGEQTWEPVCDCEGKTGLWKDGPVTVAICARENGLLDEPGWKLPGLEKMAKTQKKLTGLANKAKLHSFCSKPKCMHGFQVPGNHPQALELDRANGNTMWPDAEVTELSQIDEHKSFVDKGIGFNPGSHHKKIPVHIECAAKHDERHKARLAETPVNSACSSIVSLLFQGSSMVQRHGLLTLAMPILKLVQRKS